VYDVGLDTWWQVSTTPLTNQQMAERLAPQASAQSAKPERR
jgi:microcin C transport system substrate-binding protein